MNSALSRSACLLTALAFAVISSAAAYSQNSIQILGEKEANVVIPNSFYFAGQSAPTQMRNAAAARVGKDRLVIAGMVDTSGYSTEISGKYEGFFITDSPVKVGNESLGTGAYGFGFSQDGRLNLFDLSAKQILSVSTEADADMKRPRPLQMTSTQNGLRLYKGRNYVVISPR